MTWTKIDDGWRMSYRNSLGRPTVDTKIGWRIIARDQAGAQTIEDHLTKGADNPLTETLGNGVLVDGKDPAMVSNNASDRMDAPVITRTGDNWRAAEPAGERWRAGGDKTTATIDSDRDKTAPKKRAEQRKGLLVVFEESGGLDVSTVDASDFSVDGQTPRSVTVVDVIEDNKQDPSSKNRKPQEVFLLMASNLASDGRDSDGEKLQVSLTGNIQDRAGNSANSDSIELADGIPPSDNGSD